MVGTRAKIEVLVREVLRPLGDDEKIGRTVIALNDFAIRRSLTNRGLSTRQAADQAIGSGAGVGTVRCARTLSDLSWPQAAEMSRPRGVRTGAE